MLDLANLKNEIRQQTRNGRQDLYLKVSDLEELGYDTNTVAERVFVNENEVLPLIREYEKKAFKESLKADTGHTYLTGVDETGYHFRSVDRER